MKPKHIQLLEILAREGIGVSTNIAPFMNDNFSQPIITGNDNNAREKYAIDIWHIQLFINDLENRQFIKSDENNRNWITWGYNAAKPQWFDEIIVNYYISSYGLDYLDQYEYTQAQLELNKSYKNVNDASLRNYIIQQWGIGFTVLFTLATVTITIMNCSLSNENYQLSVKTGVSDSISSLNVERRLDTLSLILSKLQQSLSSPKAKKQLLKGNLPPPKNIPDSAGQFKKTI